MEGDELVEAWRRRRDGLLAGVPDGKSGLAVEIAMSQAYGSLGPEDRGRLEPLLREWLRSDAERDRSQAVAIIREQMVRSMRGDLEALLARSDASPDPGAAAEAARVAHALRRLAAGDDIVEDWRRGKARLISGLTKTDTGAGVSATMTQAYGRLSEEDRVRLEPLLREWLHSDRRADRSDARSIIDTHHVTSMVDELRALQDRLEASTTSDAPSEWASTNRVLGRLVAGSPTGGDDRAERRGWWVRWWRAVARSRLTK